jgi:hypothetical protein
MKIHQRKITDLIPAEYNPRYISEDAFEHLKASLKRFEAVEPAIINQHPERKNIIVGGHQRLKAATSLGWDEFPCVYVEFTRDQEKELNVRLNKNTGAFDFDLLANHFEVEELTDWGFTNEELFGDNAYDLEPSYEDLVQEEKNKPPTMKITFENPEQLQKAEIDIQELLDRKYEGAYFSVSVGEL